jgi:DNA-binding NarL/FixJ family response regulator
MTMVRTRIFIVHQNQTVAQQAMGLLNELSDLRVTEIMTSVSEAIARLGRDNCDLIIASAAFSQEGIATLTRQLRQMQSKAKVIVTGVGDNMQDVLSYLTVGAVGYALEKDGIASWVRQVQAVRQGKALIPPAVTAAMMMRLTKLSRLTARFEPKATLYADLTERECEILNLLAEGCSNRMIADRLIIGVGTVKNHVHNVLKKLNLRSRKDASTYISFVKGQPQAAATPMPTTYM